MHASIATLTGMKITMCVEETEVSYRRARNNTA